MTVMDGMFPGAVEAWARHSRVEPRPAGMAAARVAMHQAVAAAAAGATGRRPRLRVVAGLMSWSPRRHPWRLSGAIVAAAAGIVVAAGWNAPAGSVFHDVRVAREDARLALNRGQGAAELRLGYAEDRLRDAQQGHDPADSLREAGRLLDDARPDLPADRTDPLWQRWQRDEALLARLQASQLGAAPGGAPAATPSASGPERAGGAPSPSGTGAPGDDGHGPTPEATSSSGSGSGEGGRGGSSSSTTSAEDGSTTSGSSTSTSTSTSSEDGGGSPSPAPAGNPSPSSSPSEDPSGSRSSTSTSTSRDGAELSTSTTTSSSSSTSEPR